MTRAVRQISIGLTTFLLMGANSFTALAHGSQPTAACPPARTHNLPQGQGSSTVFSFGVQGGNLRPWSVQIALDGSIHATGVGTSRQQINDPKNGLKALLTLADAETFFSMKNAVGCLGSAGNPDVSSRFISIHTTSGTKRVREFGSCAATSKYDQLYTLLSGVIGIAG